MYDHFKTKLDKRTVVHIWKPNTNVTEVAANGYDVLINVGYVAKSWYLDNLNVNWTGTFKIEIVVNYALLLVVIIVSNYFYSFIPLLLSFLQSQL